MAYHWKDLSWDHAPAGNPDRGEYIFSNACARCHCPIKGGAGHRGPNLQGLFGGTCGERLPDYPYSRAMANKKVCWNEETLFMFLHDPHRYIQGTKMEFQGLCSPQDRADVISYLKLSTLDSDAKPDPRHHRFKLHKDPPNAYPHDSLPKSEGGGLKPEFKERQEDFHASIADRFGKGIEPEPVIALEPTPPKAKGWFGSSK